MIDDMKFIDYSALILTIEIYLLMVTYLQSGSDDDIIVDDPNPFNWWCQMTELDDIMVVTVMCDDIVEVE